MRALAHAVVAAAAVVVVASPLMFARGAAAQARPPTADAEPAAPPAAAPTAPPSTTPGGSVESEAEQRVAPRPFYSRTSASLGGRFGVSAGNVLAVPFILPGPGMYLTVSQKLALFEVGFFALDGGLSMGFSGDDAVPVFGYKGRGGVGLAFPFADGWHVDVDVHAGLTSVALIPTPRVGAGIELGKHWELAYGFAFDAEAKTDLDLLILLPAPSASLEAGFSWAAGPVHTRLRAGVDADALVLVVVNTISASAFVTLTAALELPP